MSRTSVCCNVLCSVGLEILFKSAPEGPGRMALTPRAGASDSINRNQRDRRLCVTNFSRYGWRYVLLNSVHGVAFIIPRRDGHPSRPFWLAGWPSEICTSRRLNLGSFPCPHCNVWCYCHQCRLWCRQFLRCCSVRCSARCDAALTMNTAYHVANLSSCVSCVLSSESHTHLNPKYLHIYLNLYTYTYPVQVLLRQSRSRVYASRVPFLPVQRVLSTPGLIFSSVALSARCVAEWALCCCCSWFTKLQNWSCEHQFCVLGN